MKFLKALVRSKRGNESFFRYSMALLHLWTGLIVGMMIVLISLTGAIYVFSTEYADIENRHHIYSENTSEELVSLDDVAETFKKHYNLNPGAIYVPSDVSKNVSISSAGRHFEKTKAYVHRHTGEFIATASNKSRQFTFKIISLHRWFMFEDMAKGRRWVGAITLVFIFLLLSGLVVWFPRSLKTAKNNFRLRLRGKFKLVNWQLHVNLGFYLTSLLLIIALTGACITFPGVRQKVVGAFAPKTPVEIEKRMTKELSAEMRNKHYSPEFSFDKMLSTANDVLGYESDRDIYFPSHHFKEYSVLGVNPDNFWGGTWADVVTFDMDGNYKTTYFFDEMPFYLQLNQLMEPLHRGRIFGMKSKILYFILALFSTFLPISGFIIWWKRVVRKTSK